nr:tetrahydrofolate dehydrogenase/cyclohydrolase catalytic domain-containing protein [Sedimentibacter sp.]
MGRIIKGKPVADAITLEVKKDVEHLKKSGILPKLKIIRIGEREDDIAYERAALKRMEMCGISCEVMTLQADISQDDFTAKLKTVNDDETVHGILLFRPLPKQIIEDKVKYIINPEKDIDCFNPVNVSKVMEGDETGFTPCTPTAAIEILKYYNVELRGKLAVIIGRSMVVGKPLSMMLLKEDATVMTCHSKTENLKELSSRADILIAAVGRANMITGDYIREGATVIDVGINVREDGSICGDVDTDSCLEKAGLITPVPSGVGSVTTSILARHLVKASKINNGVIK